MLKYSYLVNEWNGTHRNREYPREVSEPMSCHIQHSPFGGSFVFVGLKVGSRHAKPVQQL